MFIYYCSEQARNLHYRGPDLFLVNNANRLPIRPYWCVWMEDGRYPDAIVELLSPDTASADLTTKKSLYESTFRTHEYFCYDPAKRQLLGWNRRHGVYEPLMANGAGRIWSYEFDLWLGPWEGSVNGYSDCWLRFFHKDGSMVLTESEFNCQQVAIECQRAKTAEAEIEQMKALLPQQVQL
jgi:hypothetical protein